MAKRENANEVTGTTEQLQEAANTAETANHADQTVEQSAEAKPADAPKEKGSSPKSKKSRGIPEHFITTWVDFNQEPKDRERLEKFAKVEGKTLTALLQGMIVFALTQYEPNIAAAVTAFDADPDKFGGAKKSAKPKKNLADMTEEELQAEIDKTQKAVARQESAVDRAKRLIAEKKALREAAAAQG